MPIQSRVTAPVVDAGTVTRIIAALRIHTLTLEQTDLIAALLTRMGVAVCQTRISQRNWAGLPQYIAMDEADAFYGAKNSPAKAYLELLGTVKS